MVPVHEMNLNDNIIWKELYSRTLIIWSPFNWTASYPHQKNGESILNFVPVLGSEDGITIRKQWKKREMTKLKLLFYSVLYIKKVSWTAHCRVGFAWQSLNVLSTGGGGVVLIQNESPQQTKNLLLDIFSSAGMNFNTINTFAPFYCHYTLLFFFSSCIFHTQLSKFVIIWTTGIPN